DGHRLNLASGLVTFNGDCDPFDHPLLAHTTSAEIITHAQQTASTSEKVVPRRCIDPGRALVGVRGRTVARPECKHATNGVNDLAIVESGTRSRATTRKN